jgi:hypothetical protein
MTAPAPKAVVSTPTHAPSGKAHGAFSSLRRIVRTRFQEYTVESCFGDRSRSASTPFSLTPSSNVTAPRRTSPADRARASRAMAAARDGAVSQLLASDASPMPVPQNRSVTNGQRIDALFAHAKPALLADFRRCLDQLDQGHRPDDAPDPASARAVVIHAVAVACHGDLAAGHRALSRLRQGLSVEEELPGMRTPIQAAQLAPLPDACAWRLAGLLAQTGTGMSLLRRLHPGHQSFDRCARVLLQSRGAADMTLSASEAQQAFAARVHAAARRWHDAACALTPAEKGVLFAWEQGFREDGPGSALAAARARLEKFSGTTVARAGRTGWRDFAWRLCGRRKSPLSLLAGSTSGIGSMTGKSAGDALTTVRLRLRAFIDTMQSSARLRLSDGASHGLSTRGLVLNLATLLHAHGIALGPRLNISHQRTRRAIFEIGCASHGGEILIGTERSRRSLFGAGAMLGYEFGAGPARLRCGVSVEGGHRRDSRRMSGLILRVAQRQLPDGRPDVAAMKQRMHRLMDCLFDAPASANPIQTPGDAFDRLAAAMFDDCTISLGWTGVRARQASRSLSLSGMLQARVGGSPLRIGPVAGVTHEHSRVRRHRSADIAGRLQTISARAGSSSETTLMAGIGGKLGIEPQAGGPGSGVGVGLLAAVLPGVSMPLRVAGLHAQIRLVEENGQLQHRSCILDQECLDPHQHALLVETDRQRWQAALQGVHATGMAEAAEETGAAKASRVRSKINLAGYLEAVRADRNAGRRRFTLRMHLSRQAAAAVEQHRASAAALQACTYLAPDVRARLIGAEHAGAARVLKNSDAWVPFELKVIGSTDLRRRAGILLGLQASTDSALTSEQQQASLKAP